MSTLPREPVTLRSFVEWALAQEARYEFADGTMVSGTLTLASIGLTSDLDELYAECGL